MNVLREKLLDAFLASHYGIITRPQAAELGISSDQIDWGVRCGRLVAVHQGVYRRAGEMVRPQAGLLASCLAVDAVASHDSAAWVWGLLDDPPSNPCVTVPRRRSARLPGVTIYRRDDVDQARVITRLNVPVTDPLRTLADLGERVGAEVLDSAIDRALARRMVTVQGLQQEIDRLARRGRRGIPQLRAALQRRDFVAAPYPSVLESRTLRLLRTWGIAPTGAEVVVRDGRYRLDFLLRRNVALEVDGYAYHWSPESKAADSRRRNDLRLSGLMVIETDWVTVMRDPGTLHETVIAALNVAGADCAS